MLALPERGMSRSVGQHNTDLNALCDWIEASALFSADEISKSDVADILVENGVYNSQDFASERIDDAWSVLNHRFAFLHNPYGMSVSANRIQRERPWTELPSYGFCLSVSCRTLYPRWSATLGNDYTQQGELFERISLESLTRTLPGWTVRRVGWSPSNPQRLRATIDSIVNDIFEVQSSEIDLHVDANANELGMDLLAFYSFQDRQASIPLIMAQCASGQNWTEKRKTPDFDIWRKVISFNSNPVRAFFMPFAFADDRSFRRESTLVSGIFFERYRILGALVRSGVALPADLNRALIEWVSPKIETLPRADE